MISEVRYDHIIFSFSHVGMRAEALLLDTWKKYTAWWSRGMILASGARGPGFNSRSGPDTLFSYSRLFLFSLS